MLRSDYIPRYVRLEIDDLRYAELIEGKSIAGSMFNPDRELDLKRMGFKPPPTRRLTATQSAIISKFVDQLRRLVRDIKSEKYDLRHAGGVANSIIHGAYHQAFESGFDVIARGRTYISNDDSKIVNTAVKEELSFIRPMLRDVKRSEKSAKSFYSRIDRFIGGVQAMIDAGRTAATPDNYLFNWISERDRNTCPDCMWLDVNSPYTKSNLPTTPRAGATRCLWRCRCKIVAVRSSPARVEKVRRDSHSAQYILDNVLKKINESDIPARFMGRFRRMRR